MKALRPRTPIAWFETRWPSPQPGRASCLCLSQDPVRSRYGDRFERSTITAWIMEAQGAHNAYRDEAVPILAGKRPLNPALGTMAGAP